MGGACAQLGFRLATGPKAGRLRVEPAVGAILVFAMQQCGRISLIGLIRLIRQVGGYVGMPQQAAALLV